MKGALLRNPLSWLLRRGLAAGRRAFKLSSLTYNDTARVAKSGEFRVLFVGVLIDEGPIIWGLFLGMIWAKSANCCVCWSMSFWNEGLET